MMVYKSSPKPSFDKITHIVYKNLKTYMWGDKESGFVKDWIYISNKYLHQIIFGMKPKGYFKHSKEYRTIFGSDELLYVLSGTLIINNPKTGETHKVDKGESVFFRKNTWHHAFNYSNKNLKVLEYFSPPPLTGTSGIYAKKQPYLTKPKYKRNINHLDKNFKNQDSFKIIREEDYVWGIKNTDDNQLNSLLIATLIETEFLKVKKIYLTPNQETCYMYFNKQTTFLSLSNNIYFETKSDIKGNLSKYDGLFLTNNSSCCFKNFNKTDAYLIYCEST